MRCVRGSVGVMPLIALLIPSVVLANAGTPLMWTGLLRLFPVNCLIGVGEGLVIWLIFRTGFFRTIGILLLANYASWIAGEAALLPFLVKAGKVFLGEQPLYHVWEFMWYVLGAAFGLSTLLEGPFCFWALKQKRYRIAKTVVAVIVVNLASYAYLAYFYLSFSGTTVLTKLTQNPTLSYAASPKAWVYYISTTRHELHRIRINGSESQLVLESSAMEKAGFKDPQHRWSGSPVPFISLYVRPATKEGFLDLWCDLGDHKICLLSHFAIQTPIQKQALSTNTRKQHPSVHDDSVDEAEYLGDSEWDIWTGTWAIEGLVALKGNTEKHLALELPFLMWYSRYPTVLDGDQVIYQLGDQIVLLDLEKDLIGVIARGYSPVVILDEDAGTKGQTIGNLEF